MSNPTPSVNEPSENPKTTKPRIKHPRLFYSISALMLLIIMFLGFQQFYLHGKAYPGREIAPPIKTLIILHATSMTAWMLLFLIQPVLITKGKRSTHMLLGKIGVGLALLIVITGFRLGIESTRIAPPDLLLWNLAPEQFMAIPTLSILTFGILVAIAIWQRKKANIHRTTMLIATLITLPAAIDRIDAIKNLYSGTTWGETFGPFGAVIIIGLLLLIINSLLTRSINRCFAIGYIGLALLSFSIFQIAKTQTWEIIALFLLQ